MADRTADRKRAHKRRQGRSMPNVPRSVGRDPCPTHKVGYYSRADAKLAASRQRGRDLRPFKCEHCPNYHLGTLPDYARRGDAAPAQQPRPSDRTVAAEQRSREHAQRAGRVP